MKENFMQRRRKEEGKSLLNRPCFRQIRSGRGHAALSSDTPDISLDSSDDAATTVTAEALDLASSEADTDEGADAAAESSLWDSSEGGC